MWSMRGAVQGRDTSVRGIITKGRFVQGAQHPRNFGRGHIGRGHINPASKENVSHPRPSAPCVPAVPKFLPHYIENPIYVFLFCELRGLSPNFHIHVSMSDLYIFPGSVHIIPAAESADQSWEYLSQTHECGNWDCGRAIPFLGIFVSNFRYWFFAVCMRSAVYALPPILQTERLPIDTECSKKYDALVQDFDYI